MRACNNNNMRNPIMKDVGYSTVQEFCAVQLRLYGRVGPQTLPKPVRAMESGDTEKKPADSENRVDQYL